MVWNNIVLYFQQFTKSCREKAFLQPHRGRASTRRTHREPIDLGPRETAHVFFFQFLRDSRADGDRWKFRILGWSWRGCRLPQDQQGSLWVQGLEGWSTEVNKAVGGWRGFKGWVFFIRGEKSGIIRRSDIVHFAMLHLFVSGAFVD